MNRLKITMPGAGSGFVLSIAQELLRDPLFAECEFMLYDTEADRLGAAEKAVKELLENARSPIQLKTTLSLEKAIEGADYVISSCEKNRYPNWVNDLRIPEKYGVEQVKGECGGPGGLIHGMRQIALYSQIGKAIETYAPEAWLMSFSNPMSIICTYFKNYTKVKTLGFCHQVHGSFGVISEMLGFGPGGLEVITAGVNHFNWLFDVRKKGTSKSFMKEFLELVRQSPYWQKKHANIPRQTFTKEILDIFGMYPVGYDEHIAEYIPCFYEPSEWPEHQIKSLAEFYENRVKNGNRTLEDQQKAEKTNTFPPFPKDPAHPYYVESPCQVISALETNTPYYIDAINIVNNGAVDNLPADAILDLPAVAIGGEVRSIHVGALPKGPCELSRRQITLHEMIAQAAVEGDDDLVLQALCLDPYVRSITQARNIWREFRALYKEDLPAFKY
jgi:alpha-galactosidase